MLCVTPDRKQIADSSRLDFASTLRCQFRNQDYQAGKDQADERCHDEVDKVLHDVPPLPAGRRHSEGSVAQATTVQAQFPYEEYTEGKQQAEHEYKE